MLSFLVVERIVLGWWLITQDSTFLPMVDWLMLIGATFCMDNPILFTILVLVRTVMVYASYRKRNRPHFTMFGLGQVFVEGCGVFLALITLWWLGVTLFAVQVVFTLMEICAMEELGQHPDIPWQDPIRWIGLLVIQFWYNATVWPLCFIVSYVTLAMSMGNFRVLNPYERCAKNCGPAAGA